MLHLWFGTSHNICGDTSLKSLPFFKLRNTSNKPQGSLRWLSGWVDTRRMSKNQVSRHTFDGQTARIEDSIRRNCGNPLEAPIGLYRCCTQSHWFGRNVDYPLLWRCCTERHPVSTSWLDCNGIDSRFRNRTDSTWVYRRSKPEVKSLVLISNCFFFIVQ